MQNETRIDLLTTSGIGLAPGSRIALEKAVATQGTHGVDRAFSQYTEISVCTVKQLPWIVRALSRKERRPMTNLLTRYWWVLALRGALAVLFGLIAFVMPRITLAVLILWFGAYALLDGVFALAVAFRVRHTDERWWPLVIEGVCGIIVGLIAFVQPGLTALTLITLVAVWAIITGVLGLVTAARLRRHMSDEWFQLFSSIVSILLGIALIVAPGAGLLAWVWLLGAYALVFGILLLTMAFRLRTWENRHHPTTHSAPPFGTSA
jgi:uncharacterized membrane protein HdeD (DUF308 family)